MADRSMIKHLANDAPLGNPRDFVGGPATAHASAVSAGIWPRQLLHRNMVISGASGGIGEVTACELAARGARIIMVCRSAERAEISRRKIADVATGAAPVVYLADLSLRQEVAAVSMAIRQDFNVVHVLVNNAGFMGYPTRTLTAEGLEATFATNHMGTYALTIGLMASLKAAGDGARIVTVSSAVHRLPLARFDIDDLNFEKGYSAFAAYSRSKLMNVLFTRELARRLSGTGLVANSLHPGVVDTGISRTWSPMYRALYGVGRIFMISAQKGARTSVYLAADAAASGFSGEYFVRCKPARSARWGGAAELQHALWQRSAELLGVSQDWC